MNRYILLALSIGFELFATTMLKLSEGFTAYVFVVLSLTGYGLSFYCLGLTLEKMSLSMAYAIWSGVGTAVTAILSVVFFDELFTLYKFLGIMCIIAGVVFLNLSESKVKA